MLRLERDEEARRAPDRLELRGVVRRMLRALEPTGFYLIAGPILSRVAVDPFAEAEIRVAVRDLAVLDSEGRRWMLGPEDGMWYRRENERWLQSDPPRRLVCPSCGHHNLGRHSFCVECGHRLNR